MRYTIRFIIVLIVLILLTPARSIAIILSPLFLWLLYGLQSFRISLWDLRLLGVWLFSSIIGILAGTTTLPSVVLATIIFLPMIFLQFANPTRSRCLVLSNIKWISKTFTVVLILINVIGGIVWLKVGGDEWGAAYGRHYEYVHGLAMINIMMALYQGVKFFSGERDLRTIGLLLFFGISIFGCQYGLGYLCLFTTLLIFFILMRRFKMLLGAGVLIGISIFVLSLDAFEYERNNIIRADQNDGDARKVEMYFNFANHLKNDRLFFLLGTGAGGYNSRTTLTLSQGRNNVIKSVFGEVMPPYYTKYIHPLWNDSFVSMEAYTDGTRNKPYSSIVSIWAEHGIFFFLIFCIMVFKNFRVIYQYKSRNEIIFRFLLLLDLFMLVSMVSHMWLETSEFLVYGLMRFTMLTKLKFGKIEKRKITKYENLFRRKLPKRRWSVECQ